MVWYSVILFLYTYRQYFLTRVINGHSMDKYHKGIVAIVQ